MTSRDKKEKASLSVDVNASNFGRVLKKVPKLLFWDKIGQALSVKFQFKSAILRSETAITSSYLEITSTTKTDILTFLKNKRLLREKFTIYLTCLSVEKRMKEIELSTFATQCSIF